MITGDLSDRLKIGRQIAAITTAFMLPVSTSGQAIAVSVFAVLALLTLDRERLLSTLRSPQGYLPILLFALLLVGVLWSMQPLGAAIKWVGPYTKLLLIPLVMATGFTRREALQIGYGFLAACLILLALSWTYLLWPSGPWGWFRDPGVPVKDNAVQSECFALCAFALASGAFKVWRRDDQTRAMVMTVLAILFFANIFLILFSKTGILIALSLLALLLIQNWSWQRMALVVLPALFIIALSQLVSAPAQLRRDQVLTDLAALSRQQQPTPDAQQNASPREQKDATAGQPISAPKSPAETISTSSRLDFWSKAAIFVKQAPLFGHGTGSIRPLYQSMEATRPSPYGEAVADPHNQFLHIVLQVGLVGGLLLLAMWASHAWMFLGRDFASALGLAVVLQNFVGSLFNSHLSQVTQGMLYCLAVGLLGAIVMTAKARATPSDH
ncbi:MAG: hypothetical protein BGP05_10270 [Rhizobiales bacterium 62-47]|nr:O-antigen ligase family protein [Hyphomicrobiales bacterium]OJY09267.1 MAG: hypothetical protein BGP05_10270 [Rhizobiales bacterium 62-47]